MELVTDELMSGTAMLAAVAPSRTDDGWQALFERAFGTQFTIIDGQTGEVIEPGVGQPPCNWALRGHLCRELSGRGQPEFIDDEEPLLTLAVPLTNPSGQCVVAVGTFISRAVGHDENLARQAELLGVDRDTLHAWAVEQTPWNADSLRRMADLVLELAATSRQAGRLQQEANSLSINLASTYEEISLLYRLTGNLKLSKSDEDLGRLALEWMREVIPACGVLIQYLPVPDADKALTQAARTRPLLLCHGDCPIESEEFTQLIDYLGFNNLHQPLVVNRMVTAKPDWPCPQVHEMIAVALAEGDNLFGWLAALNHVEGGEFGTVEANLLNSVAVILGIHSGNIELYRQQSELLAGIVRALTSAIDAKDPYTCGHSDRVARVAVRIAKELGCDEKSLRTLYLAGQLHDIGKIGISDSVLRKPGKLSAEEYDHIKQHVNIGHKILCDLAKLGDVLPVVLHHHEAWDGGGYPQRLNSQGIPKLARIVAVADSFDAMSSDRPYRKGLPDQRVDEILREGAGRQWDPEVIEAFFHARDDIRRICQES